MIISRLSGLMAMALVASFAFAQAIQAQDFNWDLDDAPTTKWDNSTYDSTDDTAAQRNFTLRIQALPLPAASPKQRRMTADEKYAMEQHLFDNVPEERNWAGLPKAAGPFMQWSWQISAYTQFSTEVLQRSDGEHLYGGGLSVGFYVYDNVAINMEFEGAYADLENGENGMAFLMTLNTRWHFANFSQWELDQEWSWLEPITIYMDLGVGMAQSEHRLPDTTGTHFNFTAQGGFGLTYEITENIHLFSAIRYYHLSNARTEGADRNPSWDGFKVYAGIMWTF